MSNVPRSVSKLRTAAFFHLKSATALIDNDACTDQDVDTAMSIVCRALDHLEDFRSERKEHVKQNQDMTE